MEKYVSGVMMGIAGFFAPVSPLIICAVVFVGVDFITGVLASRKRDARCGRKWAFESRKAWKTVTKLTFVMAGIVMSWLIDSMILDFVDIHLANTFTGFVCGVEFWSYLENAAEISEHPLFKGLQRVVRSRVGDVVGSAADTRNDESRT